MRAVIAPASSSTAATDVLIVGAGPAGLALACALADAGFAVQLLEQASRAELDAPADDGREIALTHRARPRDAGARAVGAHSAAGHCAAARSPCARWRQPRDAALCGRRCRRGNAGLAGSQSPDPRGGAHRGDCARHGAAGVRGARHCAAPGHGRGRSHARRRPAIQRAAGGGRRQPPVANAPAGRYRCVDARFRSQCDRRPRGASTRQRRHCVGMFPLRQHAGAVADERGPIIGRGDRGQRPRNRMAGVARR